MKRVIYSFFVLLLLASVCTAGVCYNRGRSRVLLLDDRFIDTPIFISSGLAVAEVAHYYYKPIPNEQYFQPAPAHRPDKSGGVRIQSQKPSVKDDGKLTPEKIVRNRCLDCHNQDAKKGGLVLSAQVSEWTPEQILSVHARLLSEDKELLMPKGGDSLAMDEYRVLSKEMLKVLAEKERIK